MKMTNKKGFTLVELVVVIAVLLILAAIAIPTVSGVIARANESADEANANAIETAIKYAIADYEINKETAASGTYTNYTVAKALELSGLSTGILDPNVNNTSYFYNNKTGAVTIDTTGEPIADCYELKTTGADVLNLDTGEIGAS